MGCSSEAAPERGGVGMGCSSEAADGMHAATAAGRVYLFARAGGRGEWGNKRAVIYRGWEALLMCAFKYMKLLEYLLYRLIYPKKTLF
jgi:hypothetical protein